MGAGYAHECREYAGQIRALCRQLLVDQEASRLAAFGGLIMLAPGERDLAEFLQLQRGADVASLFIFSLRLDIAIQAVKELAAELLEESIPQASVWTEQLVFDRLSHLIFIESNGAPGGIAGRLHDSDRYRRSKRRQAERELIELLDEALQRRDDVLRNEAFGRLWSWANELCRARCHDANVSQDLASEALVHLLRTAAPTVPVSGTKVSPVRISRSLDNFLPVSGVEILSRTYIALRGYRTGAGGWPGLLDKHFADVRARREVPWDLTNADLLYAPLSEVAHDPAFWVSPQDICDALDIFRQEVKEKRSVRAVGSKGAQALNTILDHVQVRLLQEREEHQDETTVVHVRLRPTVEAQKLRPYLVEKLGITRPKSLLNRLLAIGDVLATAQLYDRDLVPLLINKQDLPNILGQLRRQIDDGRFRKANRQRSTMEALLEFLEGTCFVMVTEEADQTTMHMPPLLTWSKRVHVQSEILDVLKDELGMDGAAAHNCVKRQLGLLDTWGFVKELRDG
ncbi:MAG: hypothetical protein KDB05_03230 [Planctomycetales bacterium]|nr:hypothetical protein [Planctomycetales bacterium]